MIGNIEPEHALWVAITTSNDPRDFENFLLKYPRGFDALSEIWLLSEVITSAPRDVIEKYLKQYGNSEHAPLARERHADLLLQAGAFSTLIELYPTVHKLNTQEKIAPSDVHPPEFFESGP